MDSQSGITPHPRTAAHPAMWLARYGSHPRRVLPLGSTPAPPARAPRVRGVSQSGHPPRTPHPRHPRVPGVFLCPQPAASPRVAEGRRGIAEASPRHRRPRRRGVAEAQVAEGRRGPGRRGIAEGRRGWVSVNGHPHPAPTPVAEAWGRRGMGSPRHGVAEGRALLGGACGPGRRGPRSPRHRRAHPSPRPTPALGRRSPRHGVAEGRRALVGVAEGRRARGRRGSPRLVSQSGHHPAHH